LQLGVAQRGADVAVAEHTLDNFNALTLGDQVRCLAYGAVGGAHTSAHPRSWWRPTRASRDFVKWLAFGGGGVIAENDRAEQRKIINYNHLLANCLIFHNVCTMPRALYKLRAEGLPIEPETVAALSPYIRAYQPIRPVHARPEPHACAPRIRAADLH
jgi:hypothetical protein